MLCRIFLSQGVQPARTLQLSYHTAQGSGTETGFTAAGCVHAEARFFLRRGWGWWCSNPSACTCRCFYVWVLICAYICSLFSACVWMRLWSSSWNGLVSGLELGAPNSVAANLRSAAVPVNDVWEERGADKDSYFSARRHELTFDAHVHTHAQTHRDWRVQVYLQSNGQAAWWMFIHRQRHLSSAATYYCHPRIYTAELKGSPAWRLGDDSGGFCVSLTSELTT